MKKILYTLLFLVMVSSNQAWGASNPNTPEMKFVTSVANEVMAALNKGGGEATISQALQKTFTNYVDLPWVSNFVLGRHANNTLAGQKEQFTDAYKNFMVKSYAARLKNYSGESYKITNQRDLGKGKVALRMQVNRKEGAPILIDYKIHKAGGDFKIYDMVVEGISLISTQRSEFDAVIERKGLDALIAAMRKTNNS